MGPVQCVYINCANKGKSAFRFPVNDKHRLQQWLENCGNRGLSHLSSEDLYNKRICVDHFDKSFIQNEGGRRIRISKLAVPQPYIIGSLELTPTMCQGDSSPELKVLTPKRVYSKKQTISIDYEEPQNDQLYSEEPTIFSTPQTRKRRIPADDTPKCKKLKLEVKIKNLELKKERRKTKILKNKVSAKQLNAYKFKSESSKVLTMMQLKKKQRNWSNEEKKFCMSLYYKSSGAYKHLLETGVVLAAPSTIRYWLEQTNCFPGLCDDVFNSIKTKYAGRSIMERCCSVCFDEMAIMNNLEYSKKYDLIDGFEDFGDERGPSPAKNALVFVARGIYSNWKLPVAYFLVGNNLTAEKLVVMVNSIINNLFECGLLPKSVTCDQGTTNVKTMKLLGVTVDKPFFFVNGRKIFSMFDVPHIIKNLRNNLINGNFTFNDNEIAFKDIIDVYNIDSKNKSKALKKLTPIHLNPNSFQKMRVKYATQIFSHSVYAAIKTAVQSKELKSTTGMSTAHFVKNINDLFDTLNSKKKFDKNPYKCAITRNKNTIVNKTLANGKKLFENLFKITYNKNGQKKLTRPPCFDGMLQTINSLTSLADEEFSGMAKFLMSYKFNQDVIENLFGIYRIKGGCNRNPTARTLRAMFRSQLVNNLIKVKSANCETDNELFALDPEVCGTELSGNTNSSEPSTSGSTAKNMVCTVASSEFIQTQVHTINTPQVSLETCAINYFAGWVGKKCVETFNCNLCNEKLLQQSVDLDDKNQLLIINKTFDNITVPSLKSPSDFLYNQTNLALSIFDKHFENIKHHKHVVGKLMDFFINNTDYINYHNKDHVNYIAKKIFDVKIYNFCKVWKKSTIGVQKVKILQHK